MLIGMLKYIERYLSFLEIPKLPQINNQTSFVLYSAYLNLIIYFHWAVEDMKLYHGQLFENSSQVSILCNKRYNILCKKYEI